PCLCSSPRSLLDALPICRPARQSIWTPLAIILLFGVFLVAAVVSTPPPEPIPYDLDGGHARGLLGLRLWLEELGYGVQRIDGLRDRKSTRLNSSHVKISY